MSSQLTNDQIIAKRSVVRKGMFLTSDPVVMRRAPPRPDPETPTMEELTERLRALKRKIEDLKAGKLP